MKDNRLGPTSVSWIDGQGHAAWTTPLPEPLRFSVCCRDDKTRAWLADQRSDGYAKYWNVLVIGPDVLIEDEGELLVLGIADGKVRFEWTDSRSRIERGDSFSEAIMDRGRVTIRAGADECEATVERQNLLRQCGQLLVYFDRGVLALFSLAPYRLIEKTEVRGPSLHELEGKCPGALSKQVDQTATLHGVTIRFRGVRQTTCRT